MPIARPTDIVIHKPLSFINCIFIAFVLLNWLEVTPRLRARKKIRHFGFKRKLPAENS
jgi:hypothetical protein